MALDRATVGALSHAELVELVIRQSGVIDQLQATIGQRQALIGKLEARVRELEEQQGRDDPTKRMPGLKPAATPRRRKVGPRKRREHGFSRVRGEPTERVTHVVETCPHCATALAGKTLDQATVWHDALTKKHLTSALTHDHSDSGAGTGQPVRKLKSGTFAQRGAVKNAGDVFVTSDQKTFYISTDGATWKAYSTVPRGTVLMFETACPSGWDRVLTMDDKFPRGAGSDVWSGFGTGGAATHQHDIVTLISNSHAVGAVATSTASGGSHSHNMDIWGGSGGSSVPYNESPANGPVTSNSSGSHTHTVTIPQVTTGSYGVASPKTAVVDGQPAYLKLIFCRKA